MKACKKWKFKPFIKNGLAVKVTTNLPFDFYFSNKVMEKGVSEDRLASNDKPVPSKDSAAPPQKADVSAAGAENASKRVQVSQGVSEGLLIRQIAPVYPPIARANHIQGTVVLRAAIGKDGRIAKLTAVSEPKELIPAAMGAVQQWQYRPYFLYGEPVEVDTQITVNFHLYR